MTTIETPSIPQTMPSGNDRIWAILSHLSGFLGVGIILPLVVYFAMKRESAYASGNAREALNFHLSILIYSVVCVPLIFVAVGVPLLVIIGIFSLVFSIIAAVRASNDECYHYPLSIPFVR